MPVEVVKNNVMSTLYMLEYARSIPTLSRFFYFSTDEVFGSAPVGCSFKEWDVHTPTNPYSASKSSGEQLCIAYGNTYRVPIIITNCMNVFGERQHVEKFIPKIIHALKNGIELEIHSDNACENPGSRFYIHARNVADAVLFLIDNGKVGDKYNIIGEQEIDNLEMARMISKIMEIELKYKLVNFHKDRPGHDLRYALDGNKLLDMGWELPVDFEDSLRKTVEWTLEHPEWLEW
jgi:dTDP-glucose 4,6-dehydratase